MTPSLATSVRLLFTGRRAPGLGPPGAAPLEEPVDPPAYQLVARDGGQPRAVDELAGHAGARLTDDVGQVDLLDDLLRERRHVDPVADELGEVEGVEGGLDHAVEVDAVQDDAGEVEGVEHGAHQPLEVDPLEDERGEVDAVEHGLEHARHDDVERLAADVGDVGPRGEADPAPAVGEPVGERGGRPLLRHERRARGERPGRAHERRRGAGHDRARRHDGTGDGDGCAESDVERPLHRRGQLRPAATDDRHDGSAGVLVARAVVGHDGILAHAAA